MRDWHVNEGLAILISQLDAEFPGITIGTIGDEEHQHEISDHNPNKYGRVNAADLMIGRAFTKDNANMLVRLLIKDPRVKYLIWDHTIWENGRWKSYSGHDPHTGHVHISVFDAAYTMLQKWQTEGRTIMMKNINGSLPVLRQGDHDPITLADGSGWSYVKRAQKSLGVTPDGWYGAETAKAVKDYMNDNRYDGKTIDDIVWYRVYGFRPPVNP